MYSDSLFLKSGGNFPYRRYTVGTSSNIQKLYTLLKEYTPSYEEDAFDPSRLYEKVKSRLKGKDADIFDIFEKGPKNISNPDDWDLNMVIDQYTENARMSSPGYGKSFIPRDLWFDTTHSKILTDVLRGSRSLTDVREAIFKKGEVRLAYVTECIGLYHHIKTRLLDGKINPSVIDITAFGDRLVGAAATGYRYTGIDPDPGLVDGISRLTQDVKSIVPDFQCSTYTLPIEHFMPSEQVDLVTFSPPPYNAEPYTGGDRQVHKVYKNFQCWFYGFVREALIRASYWIKEGGILGFSVLDRPTITYTEAMIFTAMSVGFRPVQIFSLSSGTPWWIFRKDSSFSCSMLSELYSDYIPVGISTANSPHIEYIRLLASGYITEICKNHRIFKDINKTDRHLSRILMSKVTTEVSSDPLFPDGDEEAIYNPELFNPIEEIVFPIVIQTPDPGYRIIISYMEGKTSVGVLQEIFNSVIGYLHWIQCTNEYDIFTRYVKTRKFDKTARGNTVNLIFDKQYVMSVIGFLRKRTLFGSKSLDSIWVGKNHVSLWNTSSEGSTCDNVSSYLRYEAVGEVAHHYTRPYSRIDAIAAITGEPSRDTVVDLFATPFNANSKLYCSPFPDVDPGSLGNFFLYDGGCHRVIMANPPPFDGFKERMIERLMEVYFLKSSEKIIFFSTTLWLDNGSQYVERIEAGEDPDFNDSDNYYDLTYIWQNYKDYIRGVYLLDYDLHPTVDMAYGKTYRKKIRTGTESVGVILSAKEIDLSRLDLLSGGKHVVM